MPFITLEEPQLRNLPSVEETKRFEDYMRMHVMISNAKGSHFNGSTYFTTADQNDLAFVFETELAKWCAAHSKIQLCARMEQIIDAQGNVLEENCVDVDLLSEVCQDLEKDVLDKLSDVVQQHLKQTNGNIGHFPYSGERVLLTFEDDDGDVCTVKFNPWRIGPEIDVNALEETAKLNNPSKKASTKSQKYTHINKKKKKRLTVFLISAAIFLITFFGTLFTNSITEERDLSFLLTVGEISSTSAIVASISLILFLRSLLEQRNINKVDTDPFKCGGFETHVEKVAFGPKERFEFYNKERFGLEVKQMHKHYLFMQAWSDSCGLNQNWITKNYGFYESIAPFIINKKK